MYLPLRKESLRKEDFRREHLEDKVLKNFYNCPRCGKNLEKKSNYNGELGIWSCPYCLRIGKRILVRKKYSREKTVIAKATIKSLDIQIDEFRKKRDSLNRNIHNMENQLRNGKLEKAVILSSLKEEREKIRKELQELKDKKPKKIPLRGMVLKRRRTR